MCERAADSAMILTLAAGRTSTMRDRREPAVSVKTPTAVMLLGVGSNVGKSQVAYGLCRMARGLGREVGFFKSLLVGRRRVPAHDCGYVGSQLADYGRAVEMPVLQANNPCFFDCGTSELLVMGQSFGSYLMASGDNIDFSSMTRSQLEAVRQIVLAQYGTVRSQSDFVVIEGGGSCTDDTEFDFTNMFVASNVDAHIVLVASGAHGGFAAALIGTYELLSDSVKRRVCGFICNQVNASLPQVSWNLQRVEERLGVACLGCIPRVPAAPSMPTRQWADVVSGYLARGELGRLVAT